MSYSDGIKAVSLNIESPAENLPELFHAEVAALGEKIGPNNAQNHKTHLMANPAGAQAGGRNLFLDFTSAERSSQNGAAVSEERGDDESEILDHVWRSVIRPYGQAHHRELSDEVREIVARGPKDKDEAEKALDEILRVTDDITSKKILDYVFISYGGAVGYVAYTLMNEIKILPEPKSTELGVGRNTYEGDLRYNPSALNSNPSLVSFKPKSGS